MPVVYLSGGMTGAPNHKAAFRVIREGLEALGLTVLDPSTFTPKGHESWSWDDWMEYDLAVLRLRADAVYFLHGWKISKGAREEYIAALQAKKCLFFQSRHSLEDVARALKVESGG